MSLYHPFEHLKHKLWPKEGLGVKLAVWFPPTKSRESSQFPCVQVVCNKGYNFVLDLVSIRGLHTKLWGPKVMGIPILAISGFSLGSPRTKCHLDVGLVERHMYTIRGEGGGFPQVRAVVSLSCPWLVLTPKVLKLCINHLVLVLCNWCLSLFLVPSRSSSTPLYPSKCCELKNMPWFLAFPLSSVWTHIWIH